MKSWETHIWKWFQCWMTICSYWLESWFTVKNVRNVCVYHLESWSFYLLIRLEFRAVDLKANSARVKARFSKSLYGTADYFFFLKGDFQHFSDWQNFAAEESAILNVFLIISIFLSDSWKNDVPIFKVKFIIFIFSTAMINQWHIWSTFR